MRWGTKKEQLNHENRFACADKRFFKDYTVNDLIIVCFIDSEKIPGFY